MTKVMFKEIKPKVRRLSTYKEVKDWFLANEKKLSGAARAYVVYRLKTLRTEEKLDELIETKAPIEKLVSVFDGRLF